MSRRHWRGACTLLVAFLAGCQHTYEIPEAAEAGPFARMTHTAEPSEHAEITSEKLRRSTSVHVRAITKDGECPSPPRMSSPPGELGRGGFRYEASQTSLDIDIPTDHLVFVKTWVIVRGLLSTRYCQSEVGFIPRELETYQYRFRLGTGECAVDITDGSGRSVPTTDLWHCGGFQEWWRAQPPASAPAPDVRQSKRRSSPDSG